jgi:tRNA nucleotidyltransferase (CCA-adding enzyme)
MQIYLVGGAVRDQLLGKPVKDRDFVVVGSTPAQMIAAGYKPVGQDFPVFLHPTSKQEYALARTERKTGRGYAGFSFHADESVSLEDDLRRRDLTINAMAMAPNGEIVDPYNGQGDLQHRLLRHVSDAFVEDPVRLLRIARFAARYAPLGFRIAPETLDLLREMVRNGEVDHLVPERVWAELSRALTENRPSVFLRTLRHSGALAKLLPEVDALYGVPQRAEFHPEIDCGIHQEMVSDRISEIAPQDTIAAFCALTHDLGKGVTATDILPKHIEHEINGVPLVIGLCERLKVPREFQEMAVLVCREHLHLHRLGELKDNTILKLLERFDAFRKPGRISVFALACEADKRGRLGLRDGDYPQGKWLRQLLEAAKHVDTAALIADGLQGPALGDAIRLARLHAIARFRGEHPLLG